MSLTGRERKTYDFVVNDAERRAEWSDICLLLEREADGGQEGEED